MSSNDPYSDMIKEQVDRRNGGLPAESPGPCHTSDKVERGWEWIDARIAAGLPTNSDGLTAKDYEDMFA